MESFPGCVLKKWRVSFRLQQPQFGLLIVCAEEVKRKIKALTSRIVISSRVLKKWIASVRFLHPGLIHSVCVC